MAYGERLAQILADVLAEEDGITNKKMFGSFGFMNNGHMVCGVHKSKDKTEDMAMFRVGPDNYAQALEMEGVQELTFTGRPMKGFVECYSELLEDDARRGKLLNLALGFTKSLPPK